MSAADEFDFVQRHLLTEEDIEAIRKQNNLTVPACNELSCEHMQRLLQTASCVLVAKDKKTGAVAAFMTSFAPSTAYWSDNYARFHEMYPEKDFLYVDRVVVSDDFQRKGLGKELYSRIVEASMPALSAAPKRIVIDINKEPPNPGSMAFHSKLGFNEVGELKHFQDGIMKTVTLLAKEL